MGHVLHRFIALWGFLALSVAVFSVFAFGEVALAFRVLGRVSVRFMFGKGERGQIPAGSLGARQIRGDLAKWVKKMPTPGTRGFSRFFSTCFFFLRYPFLTHRHFLSSFSGNLSRRHPF